MPSSYEQNANALRKYVQEASGNRLPSASDAAPALARYVSSPTQRNLRFPSFRSVLWDRTARGEAVLVRSLQHLPRSITLSLTVLRRMLNASPPSASAASAQPIGHVLLSLSPNAGSDGSPLLQASEFCKGQLPLRSAESSSTLCMQLFSAAAEFSASMYSAFVKEMLERMGSRLAISVSNYFLCKCCVHASAPDSLSLYGEILFPSLQLRFCPISPLRLVSTPLAMSLEDGTLESSSGFETGYLTLDQYRNALPLLGSDSVAFNSPLVGVWVFGANSLHEFNVWMSCVRFLYNASIKERVTVATMSFLFMFVDKSSSRVEFFECKAEIQGGRLAHHQFGTEIRLNEPITSSSSTELRLHPVLDEVANARFLQALSSASSVKVKAAAASVSPPSPVASLPALGSAADEREETSLRVRAAPVPEARPHMAWPYPRAGVGDGGVPDARPATLPFWGSPDAFYERRCPKRAVEAEDARLLLAQHQRQFDTLQRQVRDLQRQVRLLHDHNRHEQERYRHHYRDWDRDEERQLYRDRHLRRHWEQYGERPNYDRYHDDREHKQYDEQDQDNRRYREPEIEQHRYHSRERRHERENDRISHPNRSREQSRFRDHKQEHDVECEPDEEDPVALRTDRDSGRSEVGSERQQCESEREVAAAVEQATQATSTNGLNRAVPEHASPNSHTMSSEAASDAFEEPSSVPRPMSIQELSEPSEDEQAAAVAVVAAEVERDAATYLDIPRIEYSPDQRSFDSSDEEEDDYISKKYIGDDYEDDEELHLQCERLDTLRTYD